MILLLKSQAISLSLIWQNLKSSNLKNKWTQLKKQKQRFQNQKWKAISRTILMKLFLFKETQSTRILLNFKALFSHKKNLKFLKSIRLKYTNQIRKRKIVINDSYAIHLYTTRAILMIENCLTIQTTLTSTVSCKMRVFYLKNWVPIICYIGLTESSRLSESLILQTRVYLQFTFTMILNGNSSVQVHWQHWER